MDTCLCFPLSFCLTVCPKWKQFFYTTLCKFLLWDYTAILFSPWRRGKCFSSDIMWKSANKRPPRLNQLHIMRTRTQPTTEGRRTDRRKKGVRQLDILRETNIEMWFRRTGTWVSEKLQAGWIHFLQIRPNSACVKVVMRFISVLALEYQATKQDGVPNVCACVLPKRAVNRGPV